MAEQTTVDSDGLKALLQSIQDALPDDLRKRSELTHNKNANWSPYSLSGKFDKIEYYGFEITGSTSTGGYGWRLRSTDTVLFKGVTLFLAGASLYHGREKQTYFINKTGTINTAKAVSRINEHRSSLEQRAAAQTAERQQTSRMRKRLEQLQKRLRRSGLAPVLHCTELKIPLSFTHCAVTVDIRRDLDHPCPFNIRGINLYYDEEGVLKAIDTLISLAWNPESSK